MYLETVMPQPGAHGTVYDDRQGVDRMQTKHHWKYSIITEQFRAMNKNIVGQYSSFTARLQLPTVHFWVGNRFSKSFQISTLQTRA